MQYMRPNMIFNFSQGAQHPSNNVLQNVGPIVGFSGLQPTGPVINPPGPAKPFPPQPRLNPPGPIEPFHPQPTIATPGQLYPRFSHTSEGDSVMSPVGHPLLPNSHRGMNY